MATTDVGQRNIELARKGYAALNSGDVQTVMELLADDVVWHALPPGPLAGDYRGKQAVMELFGKSIGMIDSQNAEIHDILANAEHTLVVGVWTATRKGKTATQKFVDVAHPDSEGRVKEFWRFYEDQAGVDTFLRD